MENFIILIDKFIPIIAALSGAIVGSILTNLTLHAGKLRVLFTGCNLSIRKTGKQLVGIRAKISFDIHNSKSYQLSYRNLRVLIEKNVHRRHFSEENASRILYINGDNKDDCIMNIPAKTSMNLLFECALSVDEDMFEVLKDSREKSRFYLCFDGYGKKTKKYRVPNDKIEIVFTQ